jgi:phage recombination protein Bet
MNGMDTQKSSAIVKTVESAAIQLTPETVTRYVNPLATGQEVALFLNQCAMFGLNPFKREIYLIKYSPKDPATFVVGYETYIKRAERTGKWAGMESGTEDGKDGMPIKAWAKVYRKDWERPLVHEVFWTEYAQYRDEWASGQKTGNRILTKFWREKPRTMLKKVAIEQAMRMAFPDEFAGMPYAAEEMPIEHERLPVAEVIIDKVAPVRESKPLPRVRDEFDPEAPGPEDDPLDQAECAEDHQPKKKPAPEPEDPDGPSLASLEAFAKVKAELQALGIGEETIWTGIHRYTADTFKKAVVDIREFSTAELDAVNGYLHRKKKATEADRAKQAKQGKVNG